MLNIYRSLIEPYISYGLIAWGQAANIYLDKVVILQKRALRLMSSADSKAHSAPLFVHSRILPVTMPNYHSVSCMVYYINNYRVPSNISVHLTNSEQVYHHFTRFSAAGNLYVKASRTNQLLFSFAIIGVRVWNSTPMVVFSRRRLSRLTFLRVLCLQTKLSDLKMIGVFTRKIIFHVGNLRSASARIKHFE